MLKNLRKKEPPKRKRGRGGGRKVPFSGKISGVKTWLRLERACGHTISKQCLLAEYLGRLQLTANELRSKASADGIIALQRAELLKESSNREARKAALMATQAYRKSTARRLIN